MAEAATAPAPSLALCNKRPIKMMPSLMPRADSASAAGADLRDASAEASQQLSVWSACNTDLSLLLRLPLSEFLSHLLFNKSVQRFLEAFLTQISGVWEEVTAVRAVDRCWKGKDEDDAEEEAAEEKKSTAKQSQPKARVRGALAVLRSLSKRVLLVYVRVCSLDLHPTVATDASSAAISSPSWLTSLWFTSSFAASSLFSSAALLDLVSFYSSVSRVSHRPLLQVIMARVADKLPYAFGQSMLHAVGVLLGALHSQIKLIHAPFVSGTASGGGKKTRFSRDEIGALVTNLMTILWTVYAMARVRPDVLRLLLLGVGSAVKAKAVLSSAAAVPPFLAMITCLYSLTPLILQHEISQLSGKSAATLAAQPDLMHLRKACLKFLDLLVRSGLLAPMGIRVARAESGAGRSFSFALPRAVAVVPTGTTAATTSSPLPTALSVSSAAETFVAALLLVHSTTHEDGKTEGSACFLAGTPMRNLVKFNTNNAQNAFLKRANEYFEFDSVLSLMLKQAQSNASGTPGAILGEAKITRVLDILQQLDPLLLKQRCQYPPVAGSSSSSLSKPRPTAGEFDEHKMPSHAPQMSRSASTKSNAGGADPQAIAALRDLFSTFSTDYICACLSEFNNDSELTIKAVLEAKLPAYLQNIRDPARFKAGDQMDASKLEGGLLSRQSSSGFSSGSGLLDDAVDDEDAFAHASSVDPDDGAAFEEFLRRTGRVHKHQAEAKKGAAGPTMLNNLSKAESALIASRIQAASKRFDSDEDEYNDAFDDFEGFAIDGTNPLELEENASLYDQRANRGQADNADEPDGTFQKRPPSNNRQQPQQGQGQQQQQRANNRPATAGAGTGSRGAGAASSSSSSSSAGVGSKWRESESHADRVQIPASFRPDLAAPAGGGGDVREQWRRDELRKELYVAAVKAQKAQQLAPSKRTAQQEADYQHGLQQGYISEKQQPQSQPQQAPPQGQPSARQPQPRQQQQQQARDQGGRHNDRDDSSASSSSRGGFSMRGGRGGSNAGPNSARSGSNLSATATSFNPNPATASTAVPTPAAVSSSSSVPPGFAARPQSVVSAVSPPAHWDSDASSSGDEEEGGQQQRSRGVGGVRGGHSSGQSGQSMDLRAKKRKEKNKGIVGNHNRKAGSMRKQAGGGGGVHF